MARLWRSEVELVESHPAVTEYQVNLAYSHVNLGGLHYRNGELAKALDSYGQAMAIRRRLAEANPTVTEYQANLANIYNNLGGLLYRSGESAKAVESFGEALTIQRRLSGANPAVTRYQAELAASLNNLATVLGRIGEPVKALEAFGEALTIQRRMAEANPTIAEFQANLATSHYNIGNLLARINEPAKSLESHTHALAIWRILSDANPNVADYQSGVSDGLIGFGLAKDALGQPVEAVASLRQGIKLGEPLASGPTRYFDLACFQARLAGAASSPASGLSAEQARAEADRAMLMLRRALASGYRNIKNMKTNKDLDPIRSRPEFQLIMMDLAIPANPFALKDQSRKLGLDPASFEDGTSPSLRRLTFIRRSNASVALA